MPNTILIALILLLPLAGFLINGIFGRKYIGKLAGILSTLLLLASFIICLYTAYGYFYQFGMVDGIYQKIVPFEWNWLSFANGLVLKMGFLLDPLSAMMLLVVSFVSLMVHIYSLSYMKGEERFATYYAFLGLFSFSMLGLVLSSNIFQIYFFWELVGVSSYLLIGFYYDRPSAVMACKKAFIVTRFADFGFLIGILVLSYYTGSLDFQTILERLSSPESSETGMALQASFLGISALSWGLILVFIGGAGKSALFPLHIWLPDAMEGPTPVSALIHAATMVVAGVFLVARLFPVYAISGPGVLESVAWVGVISALIAALIACTQTDIKRVLAYSTMSQIGYMIFALGVSGYGGGNNGDIGLGYTASLFHLFTHALFKALLFLGAGVVIHYVHSNEIRDMGGLKKKLPVTHICFLIACLAIAGVPPFSGFFSKEEILYAAWLHEPAIFFIGLISSGITAFYMFRLYFGIFHSRTYKGHETANHAEGGPAILIPLVLLAIGAATAGFIPFGHFVSSDGKPLDMPFHLRFSLAPVLLGLTGILLAGWLYASGSDRPEKIRLALGGFYRLLYRKFYIDEIYLFVTRKFLFNIIGRAAAWTDKNVVDGLVDLLGAATRGLSVLLRGMQSGKVQQYALYFLGGALALAFLFIYVWK